MFAGAQKVSANHEPTIIAAVLATLSWIPISLAALLAHHPTVVPIAVIEVIWSCGITLQLTAGSLHLLQRA
jgi:hypothetical protein